MIEEDAKKERDNMTQQEKEEFTRRWNAAGRESEKRQEVERMPSAERIALVERLVRENKSNKEIAEILGIKQSSVRSTIVKCGVERDKNRPCKMCGKTNDRMENVDYYEAREIWRKGWLGRGYAALVTVDGKLLDTIPKVTKFFGFRGEGY